MQVIKKLQELGYQFTLQDSDLKLTFAGSSYPDPGLVKPLIAELKENKQDAILYIRHEQVYQQADIIDFAAEAEKIKAQLQRTGTARIRSKTLQEDVIFAVDESAAQKAKSASSEAVIYTLAELQELVKGRKSTKQELQKIHQAKKIFGAKIIRNGQDSFDDR